jgi:hypothetical protein
MIPLCFCQQTVQPHLRRAAALLASTVQPAIGRHLRAHRALQVAARRRAAAQLQQVEQPAAGDAAAAARPLGAAAASAQAETQHPSAHAQTLTASRK